MEAELFSWNLEVERQLGHLPHDRRLMSPAIAEIVIHRLMRALNIGVAPAVEVVSVSEARQRDPLQWIFKAISDSRLAFCADLNKTKADWVLAVAKIPAAVPVQLLLAYLHHRGLKWATKCDLKGYQVPASCDSVELALLGKLNAAASDGRLNLREIKAVMREMRLLNRTASAQLWPLVYWEYSKLLLWAGSPSEISELPNAAQFYADFNAKTARWSNIRRAIDWKSTGMLRIHAGRLFCGVSAGHAGNVLVDKFGCLYSVDFEAAAITDGAELPLLFSNIVVGTNAWEAMRPISHLCDREIREAFCGLPEEFNWPLGSAEKTADHYISRLHRWQELFRQKDRR